MPCHYLLVGGTGGRSAASRRQKGERSSPDPSDLLDRCNAAPERPPGHDHDEATQEDQRRRTCCAEVVAVAGESDVVPTVCSLVFRAFAPGPVNGVRSPGSVSEKPRTALTLPSRSVSTSIPRSAGLPGGPNRQGWAAVSGP